MDWSLEMFHCGFVRMEYSQDQVDTRLGHNYLAVIKGTPKLGRYRYPLDRY